MFLLLYGVVVMKKKRASQTGDKNLYDYYVEPFIININVSAF